MNYIKKAVTTLGGIFFAALLIAALAPKATHALVAALVQDVDNPGRAALVPLACEAKSTSNPGPFGCPLASGGTTYTVPAGYRLVIQQVSADCGAPAIPAPPSPNNINRLSLVFTEQGTPISAPFVLTPQGVEGGLFLISTPIPTLFTLNQSVHYYADSGTTLQIGAVTTDSTGNSGCVFGVTGYLISYP
jgi:hypothetical protein